MRRYGLFVLLAFAGIILQVTLLPRVLGHWVRPDLAFLVAVYLGLNRPVAEATLPVVVIGYLTDIFSGMPTGMFLLIYLLCFYAAGFLVKVLYFRGKLFPLVIALLLSLAYIALMSVLVLLGEVYTPREAGITLTRAFAFAVVNVIFGVGLFRICGRVDRFSEQHSVRSRTLSNVLPGD